MQLIKDEKIVEDSWQHLIEITSDIDLPRGDVIVPFSYWSDNRKILLNGELRNREGMLGVCINSDDDIHIVAKDIAHFDLIALDFSVFTDGRCYSHARLLRDRYHYKLELRAVGDILRDQLFFMQRCGINSFQLREGKDAQDALNAFSEISVKYQTAADGVDPVYKYR